MKIAICAIVRMENRYLPAWLRYHLNIGFDHIFLYDNARDGEEHVEEMLELNPALVPFVSVFHCYNKLGAQVPAYSEFYHSHTVTNYDYIAFIDVDEFVTIDSKFADIKRFIEYLNSPDAISLHWMCFGDNGLLVDDGRSDCERFVTPLPKTYSSSNMFGKQPFNCHVKTIYKTGLNIEAILPHCSSGDYCLVNSSGQQIEKLQQQPSFTFENCYVKHFITRTIEEFLNTKIKRSSFAGRPKGHYNISGFFSFNRPTIRKYLIYRRACKRYNQPKMSLKEWIKCILKMWIINSFLK